MFYLASASPRRRELLTQIGVQFELAPVDIDETPKPGEGAQSYVERLAREKAVTSLAAIRADGDNNDASRAVVLGSDTSVIINNEILTKPEDTADAKRMLQRLSGNSHQVFTAVAVVSQQKQSIISVTTDVCFRPLSDDEIDAYIATGEPMDKAGSYGIQGKGAILVDKISGSYSNVVGLPLTETAALLKSFNIEVWSGDQQG
ncbi:MAG: Maf-like protein [Saccharospirillaceae bacterium]|jgi:septum formation protein|nr:Maf-like protein [Saccharospirillaceae bacterium]